MWRVKETLFTLSAGDGDQLALVVYDDGCYGIHRNDQPIRTFRWKADQLEACVSALACIGGVDGHALIRQTADRPVPIPPVS